MKFFSICGMVYRNEIFKRFCFLFNEPSLPFHGLIQSPILKLYIIFLSNVP